jgi:hypothetical protein
MTRMMIWMFQMKLLPQQQLEGRLLLPLSGFRAGVQMLISLQFEFYMY